MLVPLPSHWRPSRGFIWVVIDAGIAGYGDMLSHDHFCSPTGYDTLLAANQLGIVSCSLLFHTLSYFLNIASRYKSSYCHCRQYRRFYFRWSVPLCCIHGYRHADYAERNKEKQITQQSTSGQYL